MSGESLKMGHTNKKGCCGACPFAFTDESEYVQGLGCLPEPYDIKKMKEESGHNWACHEDETKICTGYVLHAKKYWPHHDVKSGGLISYTNWHQFGPEEAMRLAGLQNNTQE